MDYLNSAYIFLLKDHKQGAECMSLIPVLRRQRQVDLRVQGQTVSLQSMFQDNQGYTEKLGLGKTKKQTNKPEEYIFYDLISMRVENNTLSHVSQSND